MPITQGDSLKYRGYHHFCLNVASVDETLAKLCDPFGNLVELAEVLP